MSSCDIRVFDATLQVKGPSRLYATPDVLFQFSSFDAASSGTGAFSQGSVVSMRFIDAGTGARVPTPAGIRVAFLSGADGSSVEAVPWTDGEFALLIDRPYSVWMRETLLFRTMPASHETVVRIFDEIGAVEPGFRVL